MAGDPGSGKSTLAREIGDATGAVVIDKDIIKTAALSAGAVEDTAASLAYEAMFGLARSLLEQVHSVILDSPAYFTVIREKGRHLAGERGVAYHIIECVAERDLVAARLSSRRRLASQLDLPVVDPYARPGTAPLQELHLTIDMSRPLGECVGAALEYIGHDAR
jgi:predicted kinase